MHVQQYLARDAGVHAVGHTLGDYVVCFDALVDVETVSYTHLTLPTKA